MRAYEPVVVCRIEVHIVTIPLKNLEAEERYVVMMYDVGLDLTNSSTKAISYLMRLPENVCLISTPRETSFDRVKYYPRSVSLWHIFSLDTIRVQTVDDMHFVTESIEFFS